MYNHPIGSQNRWEQKRQLCNKRRSLQTLVGAKTQVHCYYNRKVAEDLKIAA